MLRKTKIVLIVGLFASMNLSAQVKVDFDTVNNKKQLTDMPIPSKIYLVQTAPFNENDIARRVSVLKNETSFNEEKTDNKSVKYFNRAQRTSFVYDKTLNRCIYNNRSVKPLVDGAFTDAKKYRKNAEMYLNDFMGSKCKDYKFINNSYDEFIMRNNPTVKNIAYITYRYVPIVDGVPVLGVTSQVKVTIGEDGKLAKFQSNEPLLEEYGNIKTKVKKSAIKKIIDKKVNSDDFLPETQDGVKLKVEKITAKEWTGSYFEIDKAGNRLLYPHVSVYAKSYLKSNQYNLESVKSNFNVSMNGSDWKDLDKDELDVIDLQK
jgi:hypothetical protein